MAEPKIRFKRDDGSSYPDWYTIPMSEAFIEVNEKNHPEMPVLSVQQGVGTVLRDSSDRNIMYDKSNLKNYKVMHRNDFIIHLRSFEGGLECSNYDGISSPAYRILRAQRIIPTAYRDYFRSYEFIHNKLAVAVVGIRDGKNIDMDTFWQIPMAVGCIEEQHKIADFLSSVDEVIAASEQEVTNLETQKKAVMKKIFSQEVRFKREDGTDFPEWEEKMLGGYCDIVTGKLDANAMVEDGKYDFYTSGIATYKIDVAAFEGPAITIAGNGATVGYMHLADGKFNAYQRTYVLRKFGALREYLFYAIGDRLPLKIRKEARAGNIPYIVMDMLTDLYISLPCEEEQHLIADFLSNFDEAIAAAKKELQLWKELKKGLLQQMFV